MHVELEKAKLLEAAREFHGHVWGNRGGTATFEEVRVVAFTP